MCFGIVTLFIRVRMAAATSDSRFCRGSCGATAAAGIWAKTVCAAPAASRTAGGRTRAPGRSASRASPPCADGLKVKTRVHANRVHLKFRLTLNRAKEQIFFVFATTSRKTVSALRLISVRAISNVKTFFSVHLSMRRTRRQTLTAGLSLHS